MARNLDFSFGAKRTKPEDTLDSGLPREMRNRRKGGERKLAVKPSLTDYARVGSEVAQGLRPENIPITGMRVGQQLIPAIGGGLAALYNYARQVGPGQVASDLYAAPVRFGQSIRQNPAKLAEFIPGAGTVQGIREGAQRLAEGDPEAMRNAAALAAFAGAMDVLPGGGKGANLAVKGAKELAEEGVDLAAREAVAKANPGRAGSLNRRVRTVSAAKLEQGKTSGAPLGVSNAADAARRRKSYTETVKTGEAGRNWYDDSGKAIMDHTGENKPQARRVAETFSVTSARTGVKPNTGFTVKGVNQASYGDPVNTGIYPVAMSKQIENIFSGTGGTSGKKRTPFADQLAIGGDFYDNPRQGHRGVHDIWDGEAWGYVDENGKPVRRAFTDAEHNWMDNQLQLVMRNLNKDGGDWTPGRTQAAAWTGAKINAGDIKPSDAAYSYADDLPRHYAQGSREAVPGSNTGHMPELLNSPFAVRKDYTDEVMPVFIDDKGRDRIALNNNMLVGPSFEGPGVYEGVNPGRQVQYAVGVNKVPVPGVKSLTSEIDPASRALMFNNEATYGLLTGQKGIAGSKFFGDVPSADRSGFEIGIGRPINYKEGEGALRIMRDVGIHPDSVAIVPTPNGIRVSDFGDNQNGLITDFRRLLGEYLGGKPKLGKFDSVYAENAWDTPEGRYGQQYLPYIFPDREDGRFVKRFNAIAPSMAERMREIDADFARRHGFTLSPHLDDLRAAIAGYGEQGIRDLLRKRFAKGGAVERDVINTCGELGLLG